MGSDDRLTPARRQYLALKRRHPDGLLLYRMGDFYELFDDDAVVAARDLHITLTSREFGKGNRVPMAGVPHHALASYLRRLLAKGHRVAVCEQLSEPGKGLVERDVVRVLSPGTVVEPGLLAARENNYLVALNPGRDGAGLAYVDVSTGEFAVTEFAAAEQAALEAELVRLAPAECLVPEGKAVGSRQSAVGEVAEPSTADCRLPTAVQCPITVCPPRWFQEGPARERLLRHFGVASLEPFGCDALPLAAGAAAAVLAYVESTNRDLARLLRDLRAYSTEAHVILDAHTRRNLELTRAARSGERTGSLLAALDHTRTAMGGRLLRRWLSRPLRDVNAIDRRLDMVEALTRDPDRRAALLAALERTGDLERLAGRARQGIATPRDLLALAAGLRTAAEVQSVLAAMEPAPVPGFRPAGDGGRPGLCPTGPHRPPNPGGGEPIVPGDSPFPAGPSAGSERSGDRRAGERERVARPGEGPRRPPKGAGGVGPARIDPAPDVAALIEQAVMEDGSRIIRPGFDAELDELVGTVGAAQQTLLAMERRERERTGIRSLKVGFNKVFGYYIEVSKSNLKHVPTDFIRRQTLANGERFVTPELKEWEARILRAEERIGAREGQVFAGVLERAGGEVGRLLATAAALAELDVLATFAELAVQRRYVRPVLDDSTTIAIEGGRHPVVELALDEGAFVANDVSLGDGPTLLLITGPNMAGKSTYLRQVALIVLLAQAGCFVPAARARIGVVDRIFTRVGAQDDLAAGASTFLVEMLETAAILRHATPRSLLVFDEIGRGTSTFDGLSIAQAVAEDVHDRIGARTLFATHYHELTALAGRLAGVRNYNVAAAEEQGRIVFLRRVVPGGADRSYGIHVARLAGMPEHVTTRAEALLAGLERDARAPAGTSPRRVAETGRASTGGDAASAGPLPTPPPILAEGAKPAAGAGEAVPGTDASSSPRIGGPVRTGGAQPRPAPVPDRPGARRAGRPSSCPACELERQAGLLDQVRALNLAATTPIAALNFLLSLQEKLASDIPGVCAHQPVRPRLAVVDRPVAPEATPHAEPPVSAPPPRAVRRSQGLHAYLRPRRGPDAGWNPDARP